MGGVIFDYTPGRMDARFRHAAMSGMIVLRIRMNEAFVTMTQSDDRGNRMMYQRCHLMAILVWRSLIIRKSAR